MCPFCIANLALVAGGAASTGGLTALIANKLRKKSKAGEISNNFKRRIKSRARLTQEYRHSAERFAGRA
jgi:hypothetical protein